MPVCHPIASGNLLRVSRTPRVISPCTVFHDDFCQLVRSYWQRVPDGFAFIYLGGLARPDKVYQRDPKRLAVRNAANGTAPWCTHAYVLSSETAGQLHRAFNFLLVRTAPPLVPYPAGPAAAHRRAERAAPRRTTHVRTHTQSPLRLACWARSFEAGSPTSSRAPAALPSRREAARISRSPSCL